MLNSSLKYNNIITKQNNYITIFQHIIYYILSYRNNLL